jgi:hypothetical protein
LDGARWIGPEELAWIDNRIAHVTVFNVSNRSVRTATFHTAADGRTGSPAPNPESRGFVETEEAALQETLESIAWQEWSGSKLAGAIPRPVTFTLGPNTRIVSYAGDISTDTACWLVRTRSHIPPRFDWRTFRFGSSARMQLLISRYNGDDLRTFDATGLPGSDSSAYPFRISLSPGGRYVSVQCAGAAYAVKTSLLSGRD